MIFSFLIISRTFGAGVVGDYLPRPAGTKSVPLAWADFSRPSAYFLTFGSPRYLLNLNKYILKKVSISQAFGLFQEEIWQSLFFRAFGVFQEEIWLGLFFRGCGFFRGEKMTKYF
jgi:hypothetical protein